MNWVVVGAYGLLVVDLITPVLLLVMGIVAITSPRILTKAQGAEFESARIKLKNAGWLMVISGFILLLVVLIRIL